jgi:hypothetical protein
MGRLEMNSPVLIIGGGVLLVTLVVGILGYRSLAREPVARQPTPASGSESSAS